MRVCLSDSARQKIVILFGEAVTVLWLDGGGRICFLAEAEGRLDSHARLIILFLWNLGISAAKLAEAEERLKVSESMICSMTKGERKNPALLTTVCVAQLLSIA